MSHLTAGVSFVPQPRTTFDFRISGLSKESFTTAKVGDVLCSPSFTALGSEWEVHVYLGGDDDEQANYVSVFLGLVASERKDVNATFTLCIPGVRITGHATFGPDLCGQARFLPHSALLAAPYKYFPGGVMTVTATVQLTQAKKHVEETRAVVRSQPPPCQLIIVSDPFCSIERCHVTRRHHHLRMGVAAAERRRCGCDAVLRRGAHPSALACALPALPRVSRPPPRPARRRCILGAGA